MDLDTRRRFYAEEIEATANLHSPALVDALATVPRERFLPPGPWAIRGEADFMAPLRQTRDADPKHVYHNLSVGIDPSRMLFNGAPGLLATAIDALALTPGARVLHLGTGLGYYTAILGHCVGESGRVVGIEVDAGLAAGARENLASMPWVEIRNDAGAAPLDEKFDAMLINAGVTHPQSTWLDALAPHGRLILPLTATMGMAGPMASIGKGLLVLLTATDDPQRFDARTVTFVAIYSALSLRDPAINQEIGQALAKQPFVQIAGLRRDAHDRADTCWLHTPNFCLVAHAAKSSSDLPKITLRQQ